MGNPRYSQAAQLQPKALRFCSCGEKVKEVAAHQHSVAHAKTKDGHRFVSFSQWKAQRQALVEVAHQAVTRCYMEECHRDAVCIWRRPESWSRAPAESVPICEVHSRGIRRCGIGTFTPLFDQEPRSPQ